jgi:hypothetical protein
LKEKNIFLRKKVGILRGGVAPEGDLVYVEALAEGKTESPFYL